MQNDCLIGSLNLNDCERHAELRIEVSVESLWLATDAAEVGTFHLDLITDVVTWFHRTKMFGNSSGVSVSIRDFHASLHPEDFDATAAAFCLGDLSNCSRHLA